MQIRREPRHRRDAPPVFRGGGPPARTSRSFARAAVYVMTYTVYTPYTQLTSRQQNVSVTFFEKCTIRKNQLAAFSRNARFFFEQRALAAKQAIFTFCFPRSEGWRSQNRKTRPPQRAAKACITRFFCHGKSSSVHFSVFLPPCAASAHPPNPIIRRQRPQRSQTSTKASRTAHPASKRSEKKNASLRRSWR